MLAIRLIGGLHAEHDGRTIELAVPGRAAALLGWLALHPGRHPRARPAAALWPDAEPAGARANLRSAMWTLRTALGPAGSYLEADRTTLGLAAAGVWVDVREVERLTATGDARAAAGICDGELLAEFDEEWALEAREVFAGLVARPGMDAMGGGPLNEGAAGAGPEPPGVVASWGQPLIGRDAELGRLTACWRAAAAGHGRVVVLGGVGGIGKTRLCEELAALAAVDGALVAVGTANGRAMDGGGDGGRGAAAAGAGGISTAPLAVWTEALTDLAAAGGPLPPADPWAADLARVVPAAAPGAARRAGPGADPQLEQVRLFEAVLTFVARAARARPVLLVLEDLHLADPSSLDLVAFAARRVPRLPVLLLLTSRDRVPLRSPHEELRVGALSAAQVGSLAAATADLDPALVAAVVDVADGSPLIAIETALGCARGLDPRGGLAEATRAATDRLSRPARLLVELVAVFGRDVSAAELREFPVRGTERAVAEAADLLRARGGALGFRHALLAEAVYRELPEPARIRRHEMVAEVLRRSAVRAKAGHGPAAPQRAAETARHLRLAGLDRLAVGQLRGAAADARAAAGLAEAAQFLREAAAIDGRDPELLVEVAEVEAWRGRLDESDAAFIRALELTAPDDDAALIEAWLRRGRWMRGALCYPRESKRSYRNALEVLDRSADGGAQATPDGAAGPDAVAALDHAAEPSAIATRAEALAGLAWAESVAGDPAAVDPLLAEIDALLRHGSPPTDLLTLDIGVARAHALIRSGRFAESYAPLIAAGAAAGRAGRPDMSYSCLINAASAAACVGDFERALDFADRCLPLVESNGLLLLAVFVHSARGALLRGLGRHREAVVCCEQECSVAGRLGRPEIEGLADYDRGLLAALYGDHDAAAERFAAALDRDAPVSRPHARLSRAEALARAGRLDEAEHELRATTAEPVAPGDFPDLLVARLTRVQGLVAARRGDVATARRRLTEAAALWRRRSRPARAPADARGPGPGPPTPTARTTGDQYVAALIDLGRPPMTLLLVPDTELAAITADLALLAGTEP